MVETNSLKSHTPAPPRPARATPAHHANPQQPTRLTAGRLRPSRTAPVRRRPHPPDRTHQQRSRPPGAIGPAVTDTVACDPRCPRPLDSRASADPLLRKGAESPYRRSSTHPIASFSVPLSRSIMCASVSGLDDACPAWSRPTSSPALKPQRTRSRAPRECRRPRRSSRRQAHEPALPTPRTTTSVSAVGRAPPPPGPCRASAGRTRPPLPLSRPGSGLHSPRIGRCYHLRVPWCRRSATALGARGCPCSHPGAGWRGVGISPQRPVWGYDHKGHSRCRSGQGRARVRPW
jgi:hypothetical protein